MLTRLRALRWTSPLTRVLVVVFVAVLSTSPAANAEPVGDDASAGADLTLPWPALGLPDGFTMIGANNNQDFTVPVPSGFTPQRLRGSVHAPINFGAGYLEISALRGGVLAAVNLPPVAADQTVVPFDIDIAAIRPVASSAELSFVVRQDSGEGQVCGPQQRLAVSGLTTVYAGADPSPTTVADFFPPVLEGVTIYAPVDADKAEQESALTLVSALARLYRLQDTVVEVVNQARGSTPPPSTPLRRAVVVERGTAGISVVDGGAPGAFLRLTGRGTELPEQASFLVEDVQLLVQSATARVDQAGAPAATDADTDTVTFRQLGIGGRTAVLNSGNLTVDIDRAELGAGRLDGVQLHLLATHTPVADQDAAALVVSVNNHAVHAAALDATGRVDTTFDVPGEYLSERSVLAFGVTYTPRMPCTPLIAPLTFELDDRSTLTMRRGGDVGAEFGSLPSAFSPEFFVALDGTNPDQLAYAARVVVGMSGLTTATLIPRVVDVRAAAEADRGALIVATGATIGQTSLRPPIGGDGSAVRFDVPDQLHLDVDQGLGSIQVFADQPRQRTVVLVTTTGAWSLVPALFDFIGGLPDGWSGLTGNVVATGAERMPVNLQIHAGDAAPETVQSSSGTLWTWLVAGFGVLVVGALVILLCRRRTGAQN